MRNMEDPEFSERATVGILSSHVRLGDHSGVLKYIEPFLEITSLSTGSETVELLRFLIEKGDFTAAEATIRGYIVYHPRSDVLDEIYFLRGRVYEENPERRDFKMARDSYQLVYEEYPESIHAVEARDRVKFLNRHFLFLQ
jgi:outer membrane protein assembly factor BamD (BamD/ComL family)